MKESEQSHRMTTEGTREARRSIEKHGMALRAKAGLGVRGRLDPFSVMDKYNIIVMHPKDLGELDEADHDLLRGIDARTWSGGAQELPDGRLLILLNPNQTPERATVTVMEEVAHAHFGHQPSRLSVGPSGMLGRHYDAIAETEAYRTAAAALLPSIVVARAVWRQVPAETLAAEYGVSIELVEFRIKILRLWSCYRENRDAA